MDNVLFYLISLVLFLVIIKESMGIFFTKKNMPCFLSVLVWIIFAVVETVGTRCITIPILRVFFDIACCLICCLFLYEGNFRKKVICVIVIELLGMITEALVGYIFIFTEVRIEQMDILGSFISKIILIMIVTALKAFNYSRLKRNIPITYNELCISICRGFSTKNMFLYIPSAQNARRTIAY